MMSREVTEEVAPKAKKVIMKSIRDRYPNPKVGLVKAYSETIVGFAPVKEPQAHDFFSAVDYKAMQHLVVALLEDNKLEVEGELEHRKSVFAKKVVIELQTGKFAITDEGKVFVGEFKVPLKVVSLVGVERMNLSERRKERLREAIDESQRDL